MRKKVLAFGDSPAQVQEASRRGDRVRSEGCGGQENDRTRDHLILFFPPGTYELPPDFLRLVQLTPETWDDVLSAAKRAGSNEFNRGLESKPSGDADEQGPIASSAEVVRIPGVAVEGPHFHEFDNRS